MSEPFGYGVPTSVPHVLNALLGAKITTLTRYSNETAEILVNNNDFKNYLALSSRDVFTCTGGPLSIELDSGVRIAASGDDTQWGSIILWIDRDVLGNEIPSGSLPQDSDYHPIDACDPVYSDPEIAAIVGRTIRSVIVLKGEKNDSRPRWPCEVAVRLMMDNGNEMVLCYGLRGCMDIDFSVRTKSRIPSGYIENLKEIYRKTFTGSLH